MNTRHIILGGIILGSIVLLGSGCVSSAPRQSSQQKESQTTEDNQQRLINQIPVPQLQDSLERRNVVKRTELFNDSEKISYVYLTSFGKVMAFYTVKGKVSSLQSYLNPPERLVRGNGSRCSGWDDESGCISVSAPEVDGTYGENPQGIFFFTTEGAYVEWNGEYMVSDQPLRLVTPPELVREIQN
jgi:hypothetical protein